MLCKRVSNFVSMATVQRTSNENNLDCGKAGEIGITSVKRVVQSASTYRHITHVAVAAKISTLRPLLKIANRAANRAVKVTVAPILHNVFSITYSAKIVSGGRMELVTVART